MTTASAPDDVRNRYAHALLGVSYFFITQDLALVKEFADSAIVLKVLGRRNGLTQEEIVEAITHLAFYTGWPRALSAITAAKKLFAVDAVNEERDR